MGIFEAMRGKKRNFHMPSLSGGAAAAYSLLRCAALCGRETTIETFAGQTQLARR